MKKDPNRFLVYVSTGGLAHTLGGLEFFIERAKKLNAHLVIDTENFA